MDEPIDYRLLLEKYIQYVAECEGVNFISQGGGRSQYSILTEEDMNLLKTIEAGIYEDAKINT